MCWNCRLLLLFMETLNLYWIFHFFYFRATLLFLYLFDFMHLILIPVYFFDELARQKIYFTMPSTISKAVLWNGIQSIVGPFYPLNFMSVLRRSCLGWTIVYTKSTRITIRQIGSVMYQNSFPLNVLEYA